VRRTHPIPAPAGPGQESVWAYPRPPRLEATTRELRVVLAGTVVARSRRGFRVLETSHPPNYYLPLDDVAPDALLRSDRSTFCEFKGHAHYYTVRGGGRVERDAAWGYDHPNAAYAPLTGCVAFYPGRLDCFVDGEPVVAQPGGFYGGWITADVVGPFKGEPGTAGW
jgi:uncharacterized protein (DUF427 family)